MNETEFEAILLYQWARAGEKVPAFPAIAAGGSRATCLHYNSNDTELAQGELLLVDHGAMKGLYCADITRTVPVSGEYTPRQRELMEMVLQIQQKAIELLRPGKLHREWNDEVLEAYKGIMMERGEIEKPEDIGEFYYHGIGHHLGLDTHDENVSDIPIAPGMVFTVEPGFYSAEEGIGIRIEDDVLVGEETNTVLSEGFPRTPDEIEASWRPSDRRRIHESSPGGGRRGLLQGRGPSGCRPCHRRRRALSRLKQDRRKASAPVPRGMPGDKRRLQGKRGLEAGGLHPLRNPGTLRDVRRPHPCHPDPQGGLRRLGQEIRRLRLCHQPP